LWYTNYDEFCCAADYLLGDDVLACTLGKQGEDFVKQNYTWEAVDERLSPIFSSFGSSSHRGHDGTE
jgi:hypothetical protein